MNRPRGSSQTTAFTWITYTLAAGAGAIVVYIVITRRCLTPAEETLALFLVAFALGGLAMGLTGYIQLEHRVLQTTVRAGGPVAVMILVLYVQPIRFITSEVGSARCPDEIGTVRDTLMQALSALETSSQQIKHLEDQAAADQEAIQRIRQQLDRRVNELDNIRASHESRTTRFERTRDSLLKELASLRASYADLEALVVRTDENHRYPVILQSTDGSDIAVLIRTTLGSLGFSVDSAVSPTAPGNFIVVGHTGKATSRGRALVRYFELLGRAGRNLHQLDVRLGRDPPPTGWELVVKVGAGTLNDN